MGVQRSADARVCQYPRHYRGAWSREQSHCDERWIRADEMRAR